MVLIEFDRDDRTPLPEEVRAAAEAEEDEQWGTEVRREAEIRLEQRVQGRLDAARLERQERRRERVRAVGRRMLGSLGIRKGQQD
jgi:serine phosphatase RsbU (regulator of sigma subunit)